VRAFTIDVNIGSIDSKVTLDLQRLVENSLCDLLRSRPERFGLSLQHVHAYRVHRDALRCFIDRRQQSSDFDVAALPKDMYGPCAVLAAAPRHQRLHLNSSG